MILVFTEIYNSQVYERSLEEEVKGCHTTEDFRHFMLLILSQKRSEDGIVDVITAEEQAKLLHSTGKLRLGINGEKLNEIMALDSLDQLRLLFDEYKKLTNQSIHMAIRHSVEGELARALLAIGKD